MGDLAEVFVKTLQRFINRLYLMEISSPWAERGDIFTFQPVVRADFDLVESLKDVEFGEHHGAKSIQSVRVPEQRKVKPTAPTWSASGRPVFAAHLPQMIQGFTFKLSREGP